MSKGIIISAPASGTGKTMLSLGVLRALVDRGLDVQPYKSGPDYIDPAFHKAAAHRPSYNLDAWSMDEDMIRTHLAYGAAADIAVVEGSMGLFDGGEPSVYERIGAASEIALMTGWPVVLVMNVSGQAQSAAAIAKGFARLREGVEIGGVVLNQIASPRHEKLITDAMKAEGVNVLGAMPRRADLELPSRHLGLVQAEEIAELDGIIDRLAAFVKAHIDLDAIMSMARPLVGKDFTKRLMPPPAARIAIAQDAAFSFVYPHHLEAWHQQGATLLPFSPLANEGPDESAEFLWLPGGYPELYGAQLAGAQNFRDQVRRFAQTRPVHGECGGYMVLGQAMIDKSGETHEMLGLLNLVTSFEKRKFNLGYRRAIMDAPLYDGLATALHGHEFHYSSIIEHNESPMARVWNASGEEIASGGSRREHISGSYFHLIGEIF